MPTRKNLLEARLRSLQLDIKLTQELMILNKQRHEAQTTMLKKQVGLLTQELKQVSQKLKSLFDRKTVSHAMFFEEKERGKQQVDFTQPATTPIKDDFRGRYLRF